MRRPVLFNFVTFVGFSRHVYNLANTQGGFLFQPLRETKMFEMRTKQGGNRQNIHNSYQNQSSTKFQDRENKI
jgi:hypothetical protein